MKKLEQIAEVLKGKRVLLITTSNRWDGQKEIPKSSQLAQELQELLGNKCEIIDAAKLKIWNCEGNVSTEKGNSCGIKEAILKNREKNPSGHHRCWASINNPDDELWKLSDPLIKADVVLFFSSVRWGQTNAIYQKLIERLNWLENRWTTLGESNILKGKQAGIILIGHNWRGAEVLEVQKQVLQFYGWDIPAALSFNWQWTRDLYDESPEGYIQEPKSFKKTFIDISQKILKTFNEWREQ